MMHGLTCLNLRETDMYFIVGKALKSFFGLSQDGLFFEIPVGGSRADIVCMQSARPYKTLLPSGVHVFEVKMRWDTGRRRLEKQVKDYLKAADYVWLVGVNTVLKTGFENTGILLYSSSSTSITLVKPAVFEDKYRCPNERREVLSKLACRISRRYDAVREMMFIQTQNHRIQVQQKLLC